MFKITGFIVRDLARNWVVLFYTVFLAAATFGFFMMDGHPDKVLLGVLSVVLLAVPMVSIIYSTIYYYNSYEFIGMLLAQPIRRHTLLLSIFLGLSTVFGAAVVLGLGVPLLIVNASWQSLYLLVVALLLSVVFTGLALLGGQWTRDKARGMGISVFLWVYFVLLFDGIVLLLMYNFSEYPIERFVLYISFLNPVDLGRILVLMQTEASALMGYSGAVFQKFFGHWGGSVSSIVILLLWAVLPLSLALMIFRRKDL